MKKTRHHGAAGDVRPAAAPWRCTVTSSAVVGFHPLSPGSIAAERHRDQHALSASRRNFVGNSSAPAAARGSRPSGIAVQPPAPARRVSDRQAWCPQQIAICAPTRFTGLSEVHRVLWISAMRRPSRLRRSRLRHGNEIASLELNGAGSDNRVRWQQAEDGTSQHRFAGAGFPDQSADFAALAAPGNATQHVPRLHPMPIATCSPGRKALLSSSLHRMSTKRRPSPSRLNPITLDMMQPIGSAISMAPDNDLASLGDHAAPVGCRRPPKCRQKTGSLPPGSRCHLDASNVTPAE